MTFDLEHWLAGAGSGPRIVQVGDAVLRGRAREVEQSLLGSSALERLVAVMVDAMRAAPGVGLAAPQIGVPLRIFVAEDSRERMVQLSEEVRAERGRVVLPLLVLINPEVVPRSEDEVTFYEGCLSVRGYGALVSRWSRVGATGVDSAGRPVSADLEGWPARIMQHEMDHLNGTIYVDRMVPRSLAAEEHLARLASEPVSEVLRSPGSPEAAG
jgi:peptide deformylase